MVICPWYSFTGVRRGIEEAFHYWLETGDVLKSEFKIRKGKLHAHVHTWWMCVLAGSQRTESTADSPSEQRRSDQSLTFNDPLWPMQWELVSVILYMCVVCMCVLCACVCVVIGLIWKSLLFFFVLIFKDVHLTGRSQTCLHVWLERETEDREIRGWWIRREEVKGSCPCWTETDVWGWWGLE